MRKAQSFILVLFIFAAGLAYAQDGNGPTWISGEVASMEMGGATGLIGVTLPDGEVYNVSVRNDQVADIEVGDYVSVEIQRGWAELIEKADMKKDDAAEPDKKKEGPQWVSGEVVNIQTGPENSLVSVKMSDDKYFNVAAANDMLKDIKTGDYVTAKIAKGWAKSVTKKEE